MQSTALIVIEEWCYPFSMPRIPGDVAVSFEEGIQGLHRLEADFTVKPGIDDDAAVFGEFRRSVDVEPWRERKEFIDQLLKLIIVGDVTKTSDLRSIQGTTEVSRNLLEHLFFLSDGGLLVRFLV
jgi:hypothetical protein